MSTPSEPAPVFVDGYVKPGFEKVKDLFRTHLETDFDRGGSFAAYYKGELVVNIWGGYMDEAAIRPWKEDTMTCFFSTTKTVSAVVIAQLVERGLLDYKEKICTYWPEFAQNGKENITLETYMSHKAGLAILNEPYREMLMLEDPKAFSELLASQKPMWEPGTKNGYHALTFALFLDQIVRRVDPKGRSLSQYFQEEMAQPFELDMHIGLPKKEFYRSPTIMVMEEMSEEYFNANFKGDPELFQKFSTNTTDVPMEKKMALLQTPEFRSIPNGSAAGYGTARSFAKFHSILANGGELEGKKLLTPESIERFTHPYTNSREFLVGMDIWWSIGPHLLYAQDNADDKPYSIFGHGGWGEQMGHVDIRHKVASAYGTNHLKTQLYTEPGQHTRWSALMTALYDCIFNLEKKEPKWYLMKTISELNECLKKQADKK